MDTRKRVDPVRRGRTILGASLLLTAAAAGTRAAVGFSYALGMPLLLFSIGVIAPIPTVQTLTWPACGTALLTGCFLMLTSGPVPQREAPSRRGPARSRGR